MPVIPPVLRNEKTSNTLHFEIKANYSNNFLASNCILSHNKSKIPRIEHA